MSYNPTNWVNGETPINDSNLNHIEQGIKDVADLSDAQESKIADIANNQIPEEYLQSSVDNYIANNQAGLATKTDVNNLDNKLSSEIAKYGIVTNGYFINYTNGKEQSFETLKYVTMPVSYGMSVLYGAKIANADNRGLAFYDDSGVYISGCQMKNDTQIIEVPKNATIVKATFNTDFNGEVSTIYLNNAISEVVNNRIASENQMTSFVEPNGADKYIKNVYVYGTNERILFSNIRRKYNGATINQITIYSCTLNGNTVILGNTIGNINFSSDVERITKVFSYNGEKITIVADIDLTSLEIGTRDTTVSRGYVVGSNAYCNGDITNVIENEYTDLSMFDTIGICGDSFAKGLIYNASGVIISGEVDRFSWGKNLQKQCGNSVTVFAKGGIDTRGYISHADCLPSVLNSETKNLYILGLGINDLGKLGVGYIGSISDITSHTSYEDYNDSFYGNYGKIIEQIKEHAPNSKIIIMTMASNANDGHLDFNNAIIEIANHYNIPCMKQYEDNFFVSDFYNGHMVYGHPTAIVYAGMAKAINRLFSKVAIEYQNYFADYIG